jgi:hypothetical protein
MSKTFTNKDIFNIREQAPAKEHHHAVAQALQTKSRKESDPRTSYKLHRSAMRHKALARNKY